MTNLPYETITGMMNASSPRSFRSYMRSASFALSNMNADPIS